MYMYISLNRFVKTNVSFDSVRLKYIFYVHIICTNLSFQVLLSIPPV